jgi:hypothetical protein
MMNALDDLTHISELATRLRKAVPTIRRYCRLRKFPHVRIGQDIYFRPEHIDEILDKFERLPLRAKAKNQPKGLPLTLLRGEVA